MHKHCPPAAFRENEVKVGVSVQLLEAERVPEKMNRRCKLCGKSLIFFALSCHGVDLCFGVYEGKCPYQTISR